MSAVRHEQARRIDARESGLSAVVARRLAGDVEVDPWGLDADVADMAAALWRLRWSTSLDGADLVPRRGALLVHGQGLDPAIPLVLASAVARHLGRPLRPVGVPDVSPLGPALARVGAVPSTAPDVRALLRAGALVSVPLGRDWRGRPAAMADVEVVAAAHAVGAPLVPVVVGGRPFGRRRPVVVGAPLASRRRRRADAAEVLAGEIAERVVALSALLAAGDAASDAPKVST